MKRRLGIILFCILAVLVAFQTPFGPVCQAQATIGGPVRHSVETLMKTLVKKSPRGAPELAEAGGEVGVRRVVERALREGGDEASAGLTRLTAEHGVDAMRAADNAVNIPGFIKAVDELPQDMAGPALRRLSGSQGRTLADMVERYGSSALRAEVKHPGIGVRAMQNLGEEGADLVAKMNNHQAVTVGRHLNDIGRLPADQKRGILKLLHQDLERMVVFLGRFIENNPEKVLFTASATTVVLAKSDELLGGAEIAYDSEGKPHVVAKPGTIDRLTQPMLDTFLPSIAVVLVLALFMSLGIRIWFYYRRRKKEHEQWLQTQRDADPEVANGEDLNR